MKKEQYFRNKIKEYYKRNSRKFYWRNSNLNPYQIMLTETFLKKTRAETVEKYCSSFIQEYSDNSKVFNTNENEIYNSIKMLGLANQRTLAIRRISEYIHNTYNDIFPEEIDKLIDIPYIGIYTANAIMCFAYDKRYPILDVNSSRVISRFFSINNDKDIRYNSTLIKKSWEVLPRNDVKKYNWGILDFGAEICKIKPICKECIIKNKCEFYKKNK